MKDPAGTVKVSYHRGLSSQQNWLFLTVLGTRGTSGLAPSHLVHRG